MSIVNGGEKRNGEERKERAIKLHRDVDKGDAISFITISQKL